MGTTRTRTPASVVRITGFSTGTAVNGTAGGVGGLGLSCATPTMPRAAHNTAVSERGERFTVASNATAERSNLSALRPGGLDHRPDGGGPRLVAGFAQVQTVLDVETGARLAVAAEQRAFDVRVPHERILGSEHLDQRVGSSNRLQLIPVSRTRLGADDDYGRAGQLRMNQ